MKYFCSSGALCSKIRGESKKRIQITQNIIPIILLQIDFYDNAMYLLTNFYFSYVKCHNGNVISRKNCPSKELYWKKALNVSKNFVYVFLTHPLVGKMLKISKCSKIWTPWTKMLKIGYVTLKVYIVDWSTWLWAWPTYLVTPTVEVRLLKY